MRWGGRQDKLAEGLVLVDFVAPIYWGRPQWHIPEWADAYLATPKRQQVTWLQPLDSGERRARAGDVAQGQKARQGIDIGFSPHIGEGEQRLDLRCEYEIVAAAGPIQRLDAQS